MSRSAKWIAVAALWPLLHAHPADAQRATSRTRLPRAARLAPVPDGPAIGAIRIQGNQRIEEGTIRSYMLVAPGDPFNAERVDRSLKTLYATGLFQDVSIQRDGAGLIVRVVENPIVNQIVFEGNRKVGKMPEAGGPH